MLNILSWRNWFKKKKKKAERESHSDTLPPALLPWTDGPIPMGRALSSCQREGPRLPPEGNLGESCPDRPMNLPHLPTAPSTLSCQLFPFHCFLARSVKASCSGLFLGTWFHCESPQAHGKVQYNVRVFLLSICVCRVHFHTLSCTLGDVGKAPLPRCY